MTKLSRREIRIISILQMEKHREREYGPVFTSELSHNRTVIGHCKEGQVNVQ